MTVTRIEVTPKQGEGMRDVRGDVVRRQLKADHALDVRDVRSINGFLIKSNTGPSEIASRVNDLFADPIIEDACTDTLFLTSTDHFPITPDAVITIGFKPGVTDNPGSAAYDGFQTIFPQTDLTDASISTYHTYAFFGLPDEITTEWLASTLSTTISSSVPSLPISQLAQADNGPLSIIQRSPLKPSPPHSE